MVKKVTLLFPGQGTQYVGMGLNLFQEDSRLFNQADEILNFSLSKMMLEGPEDQLTLTQNTQPAILTHSIALYEKLLPVLNDKGIEIEKVLGHSVGEYAALVAAGSLSFEDALRLVNLRGKFMQQAVPSGKGKMFAILKVPEEDVIRACQEVSTIENKVMPANFNDPSQIVISGEASACDKAVKWLSENFQSPHRAIELKVSAPFHSSLMQPAADKLKIVLDETKFNSNSISYIANIDAREYMSGTDGEIIKNNLYKQVAGSVLWTQSISNLEDETLCLEVGPGKVLMGLVRKINRKIKVIPLDKEGSLDLIGEL